MAFGKNIAAAANKVQEKLASNNLDEHGQPIVQSADAPAAPVDAAPAPHTQAPAASNRPGVLGRPSSRPGGLNSQAPSAASSPASVSAPQRPRPMAPASQAPAPSPAATPAPAGSPSRPSAEQTRVSTPPPREAAAPAAERRAPVVSDLFSGYRQVMEFSRRADGLPLRVERLIDEVSDFHGYPLERTEEAKKKALEDVKAWEKKLSDHYLKVIRPARQQTAQTLHEARVRHPGKGVFVEVSQGKSVIRLLDPNNPEQEGLDILNGSTVEKVASSRTPFRAPREVFGRQEASVTLENTDDAFAESNSLASPSKSPKP